MNTNKKKEIFSFAVIAAILLGVSFPAKALIVQESVDTESSIALSSDRKSLTIEGAGCLTFSKAKKEVQLDCSKAVVTLDGESNTLNFQFLDRDDVGIVYITKREPIEGMYIVEGYMLKNRSGFSEVSKPLGDLSACSFDQEGSKVFCMTATDDKRLKWSSVVFR